MEGCDVGKGQWCRHTVTRCANCKGPHFAQAKVCPKKKAARSEAKGWRSPSPKWRQPAETARPEEPPITTGGETEAEVVEGEDVGHESGSGEEMEEYGGGHLELLAPWHCRVELQTRMASLW